MIRSVSKNLKTFSFTKNNLRTFTNKIVYFFFLHKFRSLRQLFTIKKFMFEEWYLLEGHTNADRPEPTRQRPSFLAFPSAGKQTQTSLQNCYRGKEEISTQDHATGGGGGACPVVTTTCFWRLSCAPGTSPNRMGSASWNRSLDWDFFCSLSSPSFCPLSPTRLSTSKDFDVSCRFFYANKE